jgi:hypothetical protein
VRSTLGCCRGGHSGFCPFRGRRQFPPGKPRSQVQRCLDLWCALGAASRSRPAVSLSNTTSTGAIQFHPRGLRIKEKPGNKSIWRYSVSGLHLGFGAFEPPSKPNLGEKTVVARPTVLLFMQDTPILVPVQHQNDPGHRERQCQALCAVAESRFIPVSDCA